jgi:adenylosuccinate synthase
MPLFTLWRNPEIARYDVVTITEEIKTNVNALLTECSIEHPVNAVNRAKFCSHIFNVVDSWAKPIFNIDNCILVPSACRFNFAEKKTLAIIGFVK